YVFVDNSWACVSGREIYMFPKEMSVITRPGPDKEAFSVSALSIAHYSPESEAVVQPVLEVARVDGGPYSEIGKIWAGIEEAFRDIIGMIFSPDGKVQLPGLG